MSRRYSIGLCVTTHEIVLLSLLGWQMKKYGIMPAEHKFISFNLKFNVQNWYGFECWARCTHLLWMFLCVGNLWLFVNLCWGKKRKYYGFYQIFEGRCDRFWDALQLVPQWISIRFFGIIAPGEKKPMKKPLIILENDWFMNSGFEVIFPRCCCTAFLSRLLNDNVQRELYFVKDFSSIT